MFKEIIKELKAEAYDLYAQIQHLQGLLVGVNDKITHNHNQSIIAAQANPAQQELPLEVPAPAVETPAEVAPVPAAAIDQPSIEPAAPALSLVPPISS